MSGTSLSLKLDLVKSANHNAYKRINRLVEVNKRLKGILKCADNDEMGEETREDIAGIEQELKKGDRQSYYNLRSTFCGFIHMAT
jgi:hypothetical protein